LASLHEQNPLTLSYLDREPISAARVLEGIGAGDAAAFFDRAPARIISPAVAAMIPWSAARCLESMDPEKASALLRAMNYPDAVSILRLMGAKKRDRLLTFSTRRFTRSFRNSLAYPKDSVGAWMDVGVPAFQKTIRIAELMQALKRQSSSGNLIFIIDDEKQYFGVVQTAGILHQDENVTLESLADQSIKPLSNRDSLKGCETRADWDQLLLLPVVGRKGNFLGALGKSSLRRALQNQDDVGPKSSAAGSVVLQLLMAMPIVCSALGELVVGSAEVAKPARKRKRTDGR
jgi:Mg/Co/Ni transporter MgtE